MDLDHAYAVVAAVVAFKETERSYGPDAQATQQAKDRLFEMVTVAQRETDIEPGPVLSILDGGLEDGIEGP
jgi:hypothetical protein